MDDLIEDVGVGESLVGEMMSLEVTPDRLDVIEFGPPFFAQHLGELQSGDCDPSRRPVCSVRDRGRLKGRGDFERGDGLHRRGPRGNGCLEGADRTTHEVTALAREHCKIRIARRRFLPP